MSELFTNIQADLQTSLKSGDKVRLETLRLLVSAVKMFEIDNYPPSSDKQLTDSDVVKVVQKQIKQRKESISAFEKASRQELAEKEKAELTILQEYAPKQMTEDEIRTIVASIKEKGSSNFGQIMGLVMKEVAGRADGGVVSKIVKEETT